ncbi:hypothetical protein [Roseicyclus sp.]|uniref:hypothetical protein n=1 Tax=Roseicyclus sp. TaxID=1914329 RepID=UPI003F9FC78F
MERTIKIWLSIIFPGLLGFVASCLVVMPQLTMRGLGEPWDMVLGVVFAALFAVLFARLLARHLDDDIEEPRASTSKTSPFAVAAE